MGTIMNEDLVICRVPVQRLDLVAAGGGVETCLHLQGIEYTNKKIYCKVL